MLHKLAMSIFDYFEYQNANFRRQGTIGGVDEVLHGGRWKPYTGNRTDPALYGDKINDPLEGSKKESPK